MHACSIYAIGIGRSRKHFYPVFFTESIWALTVCSNQLHTINAFSGEKYYRSQGGAVSAICIRIGVGCYFPLNRRRCVLNIFINIQFCSYSKHRIKSKKWCFGRIDLWITVKIGSKSFLNWLLIGCKINDLKKIRNFQFIWTQVQGRICSNSNYAWTFVYNNKVFDY